MTGPLAVLSLGFLLGMRHATDADHVIAVSTIVSRHRSPLAAALVGAAWGLGHTLTIFVVGGGIILFGWVIPHRLGLSMEFAVGLMLIALGVANIWGVLRQREESPHEHPHPHGNEVHTHPHDHLRREHHEPAAVSWLDVRLAGIRVYQLLRPMLVGVVHGLAGSAAVALLVLAAIDNPRWGVMYLLVFGLGTIAGMTLVTASISLSFTRHAGSKRWAQRVRLASGLLSLGFGCFVAYRIGFVEGLFV
jgi:high-affinity nickel-transport protein